MSKKYGVIGGGIIGLAIAYKLLLRDPQAQVLLFEKEQEIGMHQSGNNSGVLHCGLYYKPGSLKAKLAVQGISEMTKFCIDNDIEHDICGKVVVATNEKEVAALSQLMARGKANGLEGLKYLDAEELKAREPYVRALKALLVPQEGIVDYKSVMKALQKKILLRGGEVITGIRIDSATKHNDKLILSNGIEEWEVDRLICCAGLYSDKVYQWLTKTKSPIKIVPFRGEYMALNIEAYDLVNHLIYPVPDAKFPFLGVHFTRMIDGCREVGPNAVFATKREGYSNKDFSFKDTIDALSYKGMWRFLSHNLLFSAKEFYSSLSQEAFLSKARKLIPDLKLEHLSKGAAGVRAQAISEDGHLLMDFNVQRSGNQIHILNAPSPGATSSLAIAGYILDEFVD